MVVINSAGSFKPYGHGRMIVIEHVVITLNIAKDIYIGITVPEGFIFDGASIPKFGWLILGPPFEPEFIIPACVHDWICEHAETYADRMIGDTIFFKLLTHEDVKYWKRAIMYALVRLYAILRVKHQ